MCQIVNDEINKEKMESWRELLSDAEITSNESAMWDIIKSLNGTPDSNAPNEALQYNNRLITHAKGKADIFADYYASVSRLPMSKEDRNLNRDLRKHVRFLTADDESTCWLKMKELRSAIKRMKTKGSPGPDDIPPSLPKALGPLALSELLQILNTSFWTGECPSI